MFYSGLDFPLFPEFFYIITQCTSRSLWKMQDSNPVLLSHESGAVYQWTTISPGWFLNTTYTYTVPEAADGGVVHGGSEPDRLFEQNAANTGLPNLVVLEGERLIDCHRSHMQADSHNFLTLLVCLSSALFTVYLVFLVSLYCTVLILTVRHKLFIIHKKKGIKTRLLINRPFQFYSNNDISHSHCLEFVNLWIKFFSTLSIFLPGIEHFSYGRNRRNKRRRKTTLKKIRQNAC